MGLLAHRLQAHPGLIHAVVEVLASTGTPLSPERLTDYLQPEAFRKLVGDPPEGVLDAAIDASAWLGLLEEKEGEWGLCDELEAMDPSSIDLALPRMVRASLFAREWPTDFESAQKNGGDLALAISWFLAQDAWNPPPKFEGVRGSIEELQDRQFNDRRSYVNQTKWRSVRRWIRYMGLGVPDPVDDERLIPDPTAAIRVELSKLESDEWFVDDLVSELGKQCAALDGGSARKRALVGLNESELPWEHDSQVLSPSFSMALIRLEFSGDIELVREADTPMERRRTLSVPGVNDPLDKVRLTRVGG